MALTWDLTEIKDKDNLCFEERTDKEGQTGTYLAPKTEALIWGSLAVEMSEITKKNAEEFFLRLRMWETAVGNFLVSEIDGNAIKKRLITFADVVRHIGLKTNVSDKTRASFVKKIGRVLEGQAKRDLIREKEEGQGVQASPDA
jgi:hypothetical protein